MNRFRSLFWLLALIAFLAPSLGMGSMASMAHAMQLPEHAAMSDCPGHAPPPDCPAQGTAKHAAGQCCPMTANHVAVIPPVALVQPSAPLHVRPAAVTLYLTGLTFAEDPPPPRV